MASNNILDQTSPAFVVIPSNQTPSFDYTNYIFKVRNDQNGLTAMRIDNTTNGTGAYAGIVMACSTANMSITCLSPLYSDATIAGSTFYNCATSRALFQVNTGGLFQFEHGSTSGVIATIDGTNGWISCNANVGSSPILAFVTNGTATRWVIGANQAASNELEFCSGGTLGTNKIVILNSTGGQYQGRQDGSASSASYIGEVITSTKLQGAASALSNNVSLNVGSVNLTAGNWVISCNTGFTSPSVTPTLTQTASSISTTSATLSGNLGDTQFSSPNVPVTGVCDTSMSINSVAVSIGSPTTYYHVARALFSAGNISVYGRITAVRVG